MARIVVKTYAVIGDIGPQESRQHTDANVNFIGAVRYDATNVRKSRYNTRANEYESRGQAMERQVLKMASGMNTNELTMGCTGACFFNFTQLQKSNETELVKCVSVKTFYQVSSCKSNLTSRHVDKNSFGITHSVPILSPEAALLLVSTKNRDLWPGPRPKVSDSLTSRHSAHAQSQV